MYRLSRYCNMVAVLGNFFFRKVRSFIFYIRCKKIEFECYHSKRKEKERVEMLGKGAATPIVAIHLTFCRI